MDLEEYNRKRNFNQTPEPPGEKVAGTGLLRFVVQMHEATRLHYDFRIEIDGVFRSWAVPKGPSLNVQDQRLAVYVEDHPIAYGSFEGIIPKGNYGAGTVMLWDEGTYLERGSTGREDSEVAAIRGLEKGHITILLTGHKLHGEFALIRLKENDPKAWLLVKKRDEFASYKGDVTQLNLSVKTGRTMREIAEQAPARGDIWLPGRTPQIEGGGPGSEGEYAAASPNAGSLELPAHTAKPPPPASYTRPDSNEVPKSETLPHKNKPMLATYRDTPFDQMGWLFEIDHGGLRAIAEVENSHVRLYSKQLLSFEQKFPEIVKELGRTESRAVLDGEIVKGETAAVFWIRDILHLNGQNLRSLPLVERKAQLQALAIFDLDGDCIRYVPHLSTNGIEFYHEAVEQGAPGIIARDAYSPYKSGTSKSWVRIAAPTLLGSGSAAASGLASTSAPGPRLTHLDKIYWAEEKMTKGDLIDYYRQISATLLPHLKDRPESLRRQPHGIADEGFFHKDLIGHHPKWVEIERIFSESSAKSIDYLLCQNEWTLLYMINLGCIELNPWLSRRGSLDRPDATVIDLDPDGNAFSEVIEVALEVHRILTHIGAAHHCKTSGATGLHIYIPLRARYNYEHARKFAEAICRVVHRAFPMLTSLERSPAKRRKKIYLDYLQNAQGQTVAAPYSVRPRPLATVSTPLLWEELTPKLRPEFFTIRNTAARIQKVGDLWQPTLTESADLEECTRRLIELDGGDLLE